MTLLRNSKRFYCRIHRSDDTVGRGTHVTFKTIAILIWSKTRGSDSHKCRLKVIG